jgi:hypothetical protein
LEKQYPGFAFLSVAYMFLFGVFILNLFIGIVITAANREHDEVSKNNLLMPFQKDWLKNLILILDTKP